MTLTHTERSYLEGIRNCEADIERLGLDRVILDYLAGKVGNGNVHYGSAYARTMARADQARLA